jgi:hypothetical protein
VLLLGEMWGRETGGTTCEFPYTHERPRLVRRLCPNRPEIARKKT